MKPRAVKKLSSMLVGNVLSRDQMGWGYGSIVHFSIRRKNDGEFESAALGTLSIWYADWEVRDKTGNSLLNSDESDYRKYEACFSTLFDTIVTSLKALVGGLEIGFEDGGKIEIMENLNAYEPIDDVIRFISPEGVATCYSPSRGLYHGK